MDDTISRQNAIDALDVLCQEHRYKIPGKVETYSQYNEAWQDALDRAEGAIGNLPSAQPEQQWIACTERMPNVENDIKVRVLVTTSWGLVKEACYRVDYWDIDDIPYKLTAVVAWMPLPEPYREEQT